jgi:hypothetical protein
MRRPRTGEVSRKVHGAIDQIDLTPVVDYLAGANPGVVLPKNLAEIIAEAMAVRLAAFGLGLGNSPT